MPPLSPTSHTLSPVTHRTDALLLKLSLLVGREVFYAALWGSALMSPSVRLPASLFVVGHISRAVPPREQKYMLGTDHQLTVGTYAWTPRDRGSDGGGTVPAVLGGLCRAK